MNEICLPSAGTDESLHEALAQGLQRLASLRGVWVAPQLQPVRLLEQTRRLTEPAAVREALSHFTARSGSHGWLETPQALRPLGNGQTISDEGMPLHAEVVCGTDGLLLRWADGAWLLTLHHEGHPEGVACWAQDVERMARLPGIATWRYRVYLRVSADGALEPFAARLAGGDA